MGGCCTLWVISKSSLLFEKLAVFFLAKQNGSHSCQHVCIFLSVLFPFIFLGLKFDNTATDFVVVGYFLKDLSVSVPSAGVPGCTGAPWTRAGAAGTPAR